MSVTFRPDRIFKRPGSRSYGCFRVHGISMYKFSTYNFIKLVSPFRFLREDQVSIHRRFFWIVFNVILKSFSNVYFDSFTIYYQIEDGTTYIEI